MFNRLFIQMDEARAAALRQHQREQGGESPAAPVTIAPPIADPRFQALARMPLLLAAIGIPIAIVNELFSLTYLPIGSLFGWLILATSVATFSIRWAATLGLVRPQVVGQPGSVPAMLLSTLVFALIVYGFLSGDVRIWLLLPVLLLPRFARLINRLTLRAMREKELLRLRAGLAPSERLAD